MLIDVVSIGDPYRLWPSKKWLDKGLVYVAVAGKTAWSLWSGLSPYSTQVGTIKRYGSPWSDASGFNTTHGSGSTDRLDTTAKLLRPSTGWRSWFCTYLYGGNDGVGSGRICHPVGDASMTTGEVLLNYSGSAAYVMGASGGYGYWYCSPVMATNKWESFGGVHDQRTVNVTPQLYLNGISRTATSVGSAAGTYGTSPISFSFGNRSSDGARVWDGQIGLVLFFDGALSAADHLSLALNPRQIFHTDELLVWIPDAGGGGAAELVGSAAGQATATGALTTQIPLSGAAAEVATATGSLTTQIPLAGAAASVAVANGVLTATIQLSGAALAQVVASATLAGGAAALSGSAAESVTATGTLTTQITLSGAAVAQALATAGLTTDPSGLAGSAAATASSSGALSTGITLVGQASALAVSAGGLTTGIPLAGSAVSVSAATGELTVSSGFGAAALMQATASGTLSTQVRLNAAAVAQALATGILSSGAWVPVADPRYTASMIAPDRTFTATERTWQAVVT